MRGSGRIRDDSRDRVGRRGHQDCKGDVMTSAPTAAPALLSSRPWLVLGTDCGCKPPSLLGKGFGNVPRVDGQLAMARTFRDGKLNKTSESDISIEPIDNDTDFLILASDGLWNAMAQAAGAVKEAAKGAKTIAEDMAATVTSSAQKVTQKTEETANKASDNAQDLSEKAKQTAQDAWGSAKDAGQNAKDVVVDKGEKTAEFVKESAETVKDAMNTKQL
ncbi:hypothetical protein GIB67_030660 [Kingdonia uniflora]|uniref:PPM-type phosphatase domain-containing protein n=1 Tax=Kingdonia uniflora TaxID=39325 RepID=A0A7J7NIH3_9MAGN|nr:hypothetical protein GIB67_030660 [Kingdonia uniflora]